MPTRPSESTEPNEAENTAEIIDILERKLARDYPPTSTLRAAHPKTLGLLRATLTVEPSLPDALRVGVFQPGVRYACWVRCSNANATPQSDATADLRGLAIKLLNAEGESEPVGQDFVVLSHPTLPLGTVALFRDAVYYAVESSPLLLLLKFVATGRAGKLLALKKANILPASPLDIRYWSTTPYRFGEERAVKYGLVPTSTYQSPEPAQRGDAYLSEAMAVHLGAHEASFDLCVQFQQEGMPIEDAAVLWDERVSPLIKVATLSIPRQEFRTPERRAMAEELEFSPGHALPEHRPLGGLNRARIAIYSHLSKFRRAHNAALRERASV